MEINIEQILEMYDKQFIELNRKNIILTLENKILNDHVIALQNALTENSKNIQQRDE